MDIFAFSKELSLTNITRNYTFDFYSAGWILNLAVVLPENSYLIWLIFTGAGNGVASNFFYLNLSICELFFCLQSLLFLLLNTFPSVGFSVKFLTGITMNGRPLFQCLICFECFMAVIHPFAFLTFKALRCKVICSTVVWLVLLVACVFASVDIIANEFYFFMCFSLSLSVLSISVKMFFCLAVLRALRQSEPGDRAKDKGTENLMKRKAFLIIVLITISTVVTYSGYVMASLIYIVTHQIVADLWNAGQVFLMLLGLIQPFVYLQSTGKIPFFTLVLSVLIQKWNFIIS